MIDIANNSEERKYAAYSARKPIPENIYLVHLPMNFLTIRRILLDCTPKINGLFGIGERKYRQYIGKVYEEIERLKKMTD